MIKNSFTKKIVVSAVNFTAGGGLTLVNDCLSYLSSFVEINTEYSVTAIVYDKSLCYYPNIEYIEYKKAKNSWIKRVYVEYIYFHKLSKQINPYLWLSLHDVSPNVKAEKRVVYCHNPFPFYKFLIKDLYFNYKVPLLVLMYKYIYKVNIKKNTFVVVQQNWLRNAFVKLFSLKREKIIVANPQKERQIDNLQQMTESADKREKVFFYPVLSRPFKNFETICKASKLLQQKNIFNFKILLTIDGTEENYSKYILNKYGGDNKIDFMGKMSLDDVYKLYEKTDCLLFPSKLETWGLPVSEFAAYKKPMIISDLPYAHETASNAEMVAFFNPVNSNELAALMEDVINGDLNKFSACPSLNVDMPFTKNWEDLFDIILNN
jgi:Glycosyltransferase